MEVSPGNGLLFSGQLFPLPGSHISPVPAPDPASSGWAAVGVWVSSSSALAKVPGKQLSVDMWWRRKNEFGLKRGQTAGHLGQMALFQHTTLEHLPLRRSKRV